MRPAAMASSPSCFHLGSESRAAAISCAVSRSLSASASSNLQGRKQLCELCAQTMRRQTCACHRLTRVPLQHFVRCWSDAPHGLGHQPKLCSTHDNIAQHVSNQTLQQHLPVVRLCGHRQGLLHEALALQEASSSVVLVLGDLCALFATTGANLVTGG